MKTLQRKARTVRALAPRDLGAVAAIDGALGGLTRRAYFERRLQAAQRDPERYLQLALEEDGALAGFMLGHVLEGEFGTSCCASSTARATGWRRCTCWTAAPPATTSRRRATSWK